MSFAILFRENRDRCHLRSNCFIFASQSELSRLRCLESPSMCCAQRIRAPGQVADCRFGPAYADLGEGMFVLDAVRFPVSPAPASSSGPGAVRCRCDALAAHWPFRPGCVL